MKDFGYNGRFGNQLFQYAFLYFLSQKTGLPFVMPKWIGDYLFTPHPAPNTHSLHMSLSHCMQNLRAIMENEYLVINEQDDYIDFSGYFQNVNLYKADKQLFQKLLTPNTEINQYLSNKSAQLKGKTIIALHLRFGDYGYGYFFRTKLKWVLSLLDRIWNTANNPILYIATDEEQRAKKLLLNYHPVSASDFNYNFIIAPFYPDFWMLTQANTLLLANSSFSYAAALLNTKSTATFYRPSLQKDSFIQCVPWEEDVLLKQTTPILTIRAHLPRLHRFLTKVERRLCLS